MKFPFKNIKFDGGAVIELLLSGDALPDCATIALATNKNSSALFARKEDELIKQLGKKNFKIKIYFLEDLLNHS